MPKWGTCVSWSLNAFFIFAQEVGLGAWLTLFVCYLLNVGVGERKEGRDAKKQQQNNAKYFKPSNAMPPPFNVLPDSGGKKWAVPSVPPDTSCQMMRVDFMWYNGNQRLNVLMKAISLGSDCSETRSAPFRSTLKTRLQSNKHILSFSLSKLFRILPNDQDWVCLFFSKNNF